MRPASRCLDFPPSTSLVATPRPYQPGREGDEIIVCDLTGTGAQDAAIGQVAWQKLSQL